MTLQQLGQLLQRYGIEAVEDLVSDLENALVPAAVARA